jgi:prephenate dehydrogenase
VVSRVAIVGTGLIGASVGLAAKRAGAHVVGWDPDSAALAAAVERGSVDEAAASLEDALLGAELAVVAAPIGALPEQVRAVLAASREETTVTDVGSTKAGVVAAAGSSRFVGGHPIAGSEARGAENASAALFEGQTWFLTANAETDPERYKLVHGFVASLGAVPAPIAAAAHDELVALTSHVPHVLANVIVNQAGAARVEGHEPLASAGGSLRDMTRIAGANPRVWLDIFVDNAAPVREALAEHRRRIEEVEAALGRSDTAFLSGWIGEAADNRRRMLERAYPDARDLHELRVHISDRPGAFAEVTQAFGAERVNIEDFEMQHISPELGGTLTLLVGGGPDAERMARVLEGLGYGVVVAAVLDEG